MEWVSASIAGTIAANVVLVGALAFLVAQDREEAPTYLKWWAAAWAASLIRYATSLALTLGADPRWQCGGEPSARCSTVGFSSKAP
ncbi:MAG: hypothetical protein R3B99_06000 [Polyangiales bacterium]